MQNNSNNSSSSSNYRSYFIGGSNNISKPRLLGIIAAIVTSVLTIPVIFPHLLHSEMIIHILIHLVSVIISTFLIVVSILAYNKTKSTKILFMTFGFFALLIVEYMYLLNASDNIFELLIPNFNIELSHVILLIMVTLFGTSFLKGNKNKVSEGSNSEDSNNK